MKTRYLLAGCNGAGKTTAAYALLPDLVGSGPTYYFCRLPAL
ncbi:hypothetical protein [Hymenobacter lapidarius]|nr:hypothetical protein [Hymenobacter lapidarius]